MFASIQDLLCDDYLIETNCGFDTNYFAAGILRIEAYASITIQKTAT